LSSHRGWDAGTYRLADTLASGLAAPNLTSRLTRLLVDLNRSAHNPRVFSEITRPLPRPERMLLLERFHRPHWDRARAAVTGGIAEHGRVLHLGVHSFTPVLNGEARRADLALLYDPSRSPERRLATAWAEALSVALPERAVRRNNPYRGAADGMTTAFRRAFPVTRYLGLEIEVNQRHVGRDGAFPAWVGDALLETLSGTLAR
jgi:predicted N-formylglutamate amidohydrolase